ncbi:hypothetical protein QTJ16_003237 [Diplocarpon rosae]|uniref:Zn(2)-C6 fungal-type domain-containing protein n=1 Tax=Diplocarpon rosae TaxID=946125 RepID=A0AAD9WFD3_9HELO|nr:hypothetical protein QTJ16_003237 [Diplocarpon rosae]
MSSKDPVQDVFFKRCQKIRRRFLREPTDFEIFALKMFPLPPASQPHLTTPDGVKIRCPAEARRLLAFCELEEDITGLHEAGSLLEVFRYPEESAQVGDPFAQPPLCSWHTNPTAPATAPTHLKQPLSADNRLVEEKIHLIDKKTDSISSNGRVGEWNSSAYPELTVHPTTPRRLPPVYDFSLTPTGSTGIEDSARPSPSSIKSGKSVPTPSSSKRACSPRYSDSDSSPTKKRRGRPAGKLNRKTLKMYKEMELVSESLSPATNPVKSTRRGSVAVEPNRAPGVGVSNSQDNQLFGKYFNELAQNLDIRDQAEVQTQYPTHQLHTGRPDSFYDSPINNKLQSDTQAQYITHQYYAVPTLSHNENELGVGHQQPAFGFPGAHDQSLPKHPTDDPQSYANVHSASQSNKSCYIQLHAQLEAETDPNYQFTYPEPDEDHSRRVEQSMQAVHEQQVVHRRHVSNDSTGPGYSLSSDVVQTPPHRYLDAACTNVSSESMTSSPFESSSNKSFREHRFRQHGSSVCAGCRKSRVKCSGADESHDGTCGRCAKTGRDCSLKGSSPVPIQPSDIPYQQLRSRKISTIQPTRPYRPAFSVQHNEPDSQQPHPTAVAFQARLLERLNTNTAPVPEVFTRYSETDLQKPHSIAIAYQGRLPERLNSPTENVPGLFTHQSEPDSQEPHPAVLALQARLEELNAYPAPLPPGLFVPPPHISPGTHRYVAARNVAVRSYQRGEPVQPRKKPALTIAPQAFHQPETSSADLDTSSNMVPAAGTQPAHGASTNIANSGLPSASDPASSARSYSQFFADPIIETEWRRSAEAAAVTVRKETVKTKGKGKARKE